MNFGLVGWGIASGNGGMNSDVASLCDWISHWLIAEHPKASNHKPYLDKASKNTKLIHAALDDLDAVNEFLNSVDGIIYIEHPCFRDSVDIVNLAKRAGKFVVGIPMWEWWPLHKSWALETDLLWAVTKFTKNYLNSLSNVLTVQGYKPRWANRVVGSSWGVNLSDFTFEPRYRANRFVFVNGNGGYKMRKASDIVFDVFSRDGAPPLTVYTQQTEQLAKVSSKNIKIVNKNFDDREEVYQDGDVFLFPSYWEGLCHGIYEAQAKGGLVITSEQGPMDECGSRYLIKIEDSVQEHLAGHKISKAIVSRDHFFDIVTNLYTKDISHESIENRKNIENNFNLKETLSELYYSIVSSMR